MSKTIKSVHEESLHSERKITWGGGGRKVFQHVPIPHGHVSALFTRDFTSYAELAPAGEAHEVLTPRGATTAMMAVEGEQAGGRLGSLGGMSGIPQLAEGRSPCHDGGCGQPGDGAFRGFSVGFPARRPALPRPHSLPSGARGGRTADYISQNARGGGGTRLFSRGRVGGSGEARPGSAATVETGTGTWTHHGRDRPEDRAGSHRRGESAGSGPTASGGAGGSGKREAGSGAQSRLPEERPRREGVEASGLAPLAGPGVTSRGPAWVTRVCLLLEGLLGLWCRLGLFPGSSHKPVPL